MTQQQISVQLGIPRMKVSRMLQQARDEGVVVTKIRYDGFFPQLEEDLAARFPNTEFVVADALDGTDSSIKATLGKTTADYLGHRVEAGESIAVGWGTTLRQVALNLPPMPSSVVFIPMLGGQGNVGLDVHASYLAEEMAQKTGSSAMQILAPAVVKNKQARDLFVESLPAKQTLQAAAGAQTAVFSLGSPFSEENSIERIGYFSKEDVEELRRGHAECDFISMAYFNSECQEVCRSLAELTVSISFDDFKKIPRKICVAGGTGKHAAINIGLRLGLVDVLVTDDITAEFLVSQNPL